MKKGQAAMEFLMTYGWAILVVLAAIAALAYFGVFNLKGTAPDQCYAPTGFNCIAKATATQVEFKIHNGAGIDITNFSISVEGCTGSAVIGTLNDNADGAGTATGCSFSAGQKIKKQLTFSYQEVGGFSRSKPGTLIATVELS